MIPSQLMLSPLHVWLDDDIIQVHINALTLTWRSLGTAASSSAGVPFVQLYFNELYIFSKAQKTTCVKITLSNCHISYLSSKL